MSGPFPKEQFRQALTTTIKVKPSLQPFFLEFKKNNMYPTHSAGTGL